MSEEVNKGGAPLGNQNARKGHLWAKAIKRALARFSGSTVDAGLDLLADQLVDAASKGDTWAVLEIGNRLDGKPAQVIAGDDELPPVLLDGRIRLVRPE